MSRCVCRTEMADPPKLELQVVLSYPTWMLRIELGSSIIAAVDALNR